MIAKDLYRLMGEVENLEKEILTAQPEKQDKLRNQLRKIKAERDYLRRALDGRKDVI